MNIKNILIVILAFFLSACAVKQNLKTLPIPERDKAIELIKENTPSICAYKGRASMRAYQQENAVSFNALVDKNCSGDFNITVLGPFNAPLGSVIYKNGSLYSEAEDAGIRFSLLSAGNYYLPFISSFMKMPVLLPDSSYVLTAREDRYVFTSPKGIRIYTDGNFKIIGYAENKLSISYKWKNNNYIGEADIVSEDKKITIRFMNIYGWKGEEGTVSSEDKSEGGAGL